MFKIQYESKFDGFLVDFMICPAEEINENVFGGEQVATAKKGFTLAAETFGCLVWVEQMEMSPKSLSTFAHELVHASIIRCKKSGMFKSKNAPKDLAKFDSFYAEAISNSVSELSEGILSQIMEPVPEKPVKARGLVLKSGVWFAYWMVNGKRYSKSTGETDLDNAIFKREEFIRKTKRGKKL